MITRSDVVRLAIGFTAASLLAGALGAVVQTQFNIGALTAIGASVPVGPRAATTAEDLLRFGPVMAGIAATAFLPAFAVAALVARAAPALRIVAYGAAGFAGIWAAFTAMGFFTPMPTLVAAARGPAGLLSLCACGAIGGAVFAALTRSGAPRPTIG